MRTYLRASGVGLARCFLGVLNVAHGWPARRLRSTGTKIRKWPIARARCGGNAELGTRAVARRPRAREYGKSLNESERESSPR